MLDTHFSGSVAKCYIVMYPHTTLVYQSTHAYRRRDSDVHHLTQASV
jgi:hypothetical protein